MERDLQSEIQALRKIGRNGGYSLDCEKCGADQGRVYALLAPDNQGQVKNILVKKRLCDPCSENDLADAMIGDGR